MVGWSFLFLDCWERRRAKQLKFLGSNRLALRFALVDRADALVAEKFVMK
jgi:hypothetical protein